MSRPAALRAIGTVAAAVLVCGCSSSPAGPGSAAGTASSSGAARQLVIAVIGDYGSCAVACGAEQRVANLVHGWHPDVVLSVGDNTYDGSVAADMRPYAADLAAGRMLAAVGNEDYRNGCSSAAVAGVLRTLGRPAHYVAHLGGGLLDLLVTDSECGDADGNTVSSSQAADYRAAVASSQARWRISVTHRPPLSSGDGRTPLMSWVAVPRVDLVLSGHDHAFEHLVAGGLDYVVDGAGGRSLAPLCVPACAPQSVWHDSADYGAVRLTVTPARLRVEFIAVGGRILDAFSVAARSE